MPTYTKKKRAQRKLRRTFSSFGARQRAPPPRQRKTPVATRPCEKTLPRKQTKGNPAPHIARRSNAAVHTPSSRPKPATETGQAPPMPLCRAKSYLAAATASLAPKSRQPVCTAQPPLKTVGAAHRGPPPGFAVKANSQKFCRPPEPIPVCVLVYGSWFPPPIKIVHDAPVHFPVTQRPICNQINVF